MLSKQTAFSGALGEVGVLDRQLREIGLAPFGESLIRYDQLGHEGVTGGTLRSDAIDSSDRGQ
jgi:hypothetical protein